MRGAAVAMAVLALLLLPGCLGPAGNGWAVQATGLDDVRATGADGRGIRVAILDSGIDLDHPSLRHLDDGNPYHGRLIAYADFLGGQGGPRDHGGHGTFVAGVLAARPPSGIATLTASDDGVRGLAPEVDLLVGRVCDTDNCPLAAVWRGIEWAREQDADIISLSLGYTSAQIQEQGFLVDRVKQSLREAEKDGVLVVAAAGNARSGVLFPAREATVVAVGAMDRDGQPRATSARGLGSVKPDLVAPGQDIVGPARGGGRIAIDGTSAAVPFVVAAAALAMQTVHDPKDLDTVALLRQALFDSAAPRSGQTLPHDRGAGYGLVQAGGAATLYGIAIAMQEELADERSQENGGPPRPQAP